ncbi:MAG: COX15/CtaA family protein [Opitutae bacterium]|nr:COX15/CtaA family protein [Opitutae bacterium]
MTPVARHQPWLAWFALIGSAWVFVLVALGAFTTTIGAGMAFSDWPLSNGSVNPPGWMSDIAMFAEHSHRLSGTTMGLITIVLAVGLARCEARRWLRWLGWGALAMVVLQGVLGGTRVLFDAVAVPGFAMSLGQMLRIPHGILAQLFVCLLFAIAAGLSRSWCEGRLGAPGTVVRRWSLATVALLVIQLAIAATMRHNHAGLALPSFPLSSPAGDLFPPDWNFLTGIQFAHRVMALALVGAVFFQVRALRRDTGASSLLLSLGWLLVVELALQIALGAAIVWTQRQVYLTTAHVLLGSATLATAFLLAFLAHREALEAGESADPRRLAARRQPLPATFPLEHSV